VEPATFNVVNVNDYVTVPELSGDIVVEQLCPKDSMKCINTMTAWSSFYGMLSLKSYNNSMKPGQRYDQIKGQMSGHLGMMTNASRDYKLTGYPRYLKDKGLTKLDGFTL